ncbi:MAG: MFS transporter [SAR202 cluster bacterium]|nr:MFS transporter [SAR202 cluster bacterium]
MKFHLFSPENPSKFSAPVRDVFYGWWIVGIAGFMITLMSISVFQGLGTLLVGLERHFGWSRTAMSGAFALARIEGAILGPIEGFLIDRLGSRRLILIGYIIMGFGFLLLSRVDSLWQFYVVFLVITLGSGLGGWLANLSLINNWFARRRSLALAAAMSGVHFGGFLVPLLALGMESHGFRWTSMGTGIFLLIIIGPVTRVIRNRPEDHGLQPDGEDLPATMPDQVTSQPAPDSEANYTVAQALKTPVFYIITIAHLSSSVAAVTLALHLVPKLTDIGFSLSTAGVVVLTYTVIALPAQFGAGYIADRFPKPLVIFTLIVMQSTGIAVLAWANNATMVYLFALLYGIGFGGRLPLFTAIRGEYFGRKAFATIMGISQFPSSLLMVGAPLFAGYMFDTTGSYTVPFAMFAIFGFLGAILMLFVKKPNRDSRIV